MDEENEREDGIYDWTMGRADNEEKVNVEVDEVLMYNLIITCLNQLETLLEDAETNMMLITEEKKYADQYEANINRLLRDINHLEVTLEPIMLSYIDFCEDDRDADELVNKQSLLVEGKEELELVFMGYRQNQHIDTTLNKMLKDIGGIIRPKQQKE